MVQELISNVDVSTAPRGSFFVRRVSRLLFFVSLIAHLAYGSGVGDTYQQVLAEKGNPRSQIEAGSVRMLTYPDAVIKLKDDVVVSIKLVATEPSNGPAAAPDSSKPPTVESRTAELKAQLEDAVSKVERIVNQEVPSQPRTPDMKLWRFYFHDGATRPNFNLVDVPDPGNPLWFPRAHHLGGPRGLGVGRQPV